MLSLDRRAQSEDLCPPILTREMRMTTSERERNQDRAARLHNRTARYHSEDEPVRPEKLYLQALRIKEQAFRAGTPGSGGDPWQPGSLLQSAGPSGRSAAPPGEARPTAPWGRRFSTLRSC